METLRTFLPDDRLMDELLAVSLARLNQKAAKEGLTYAPASRGTSEKILSGSLAAVRPQTLASRRLTMFHSS